LGGINLDADFCGLIFFDGEVRVFQGGFAKSGCFLDGFLWSLRGG
jgi:hypothetical protein